MGGISVRINGYSGNAMEPFISRDGKVLFFNNKNDGTENCDLWWATSTPDPTAFNFKGRISADTQALEGVASMDFAGNFFFITNRNPPNTIYQGRWNGNGGVGIASQVRGINFVAPQFGMDAEISMDGQTLYYAPAIGGGAIPQAQLAFAKRNWDGSFTTQNQDIFGAINGVGYSVYAPCTTPDELGLFCTIYDPALAPAPQIFFASRASKDVAFNAPTVLPIGGFVEGASIRSDGAYLYFHRMTQAGAFEIAVLALN